MVTSKKTSSTPTAAFGDIGQIIEKFKLPGVDVTAIVESQRKDMEALAEANRQASCGSRNRLHKSVEATLGELDQRVPMPIS